MSNVNQILYDNYQDFAEEIGCGTMETALSHLIYAANEIKAVDPYALHDILQSFIDEIKGEIDVDTQAEYLFSMILPELVMAERIKDGEEYSN